tara:strand:- start:1416 stop:1685 length:270 start_codon:yes stop_codon:yes gene_type:complete
MDLLQKAFGAGFNFLLDEVFSGDTEDAPRFNVQRVGRTGGIRTYDARFTTIPDVSARSTGTASRILRNYQSTFKTAAVKQKTTADKLKG